MRQKYDGMFTVLGIMISGILAGYFLRRRTFVQHVGRLISVTIIVLLFLLGVTVGANKVIMDNLSELGIQAFALSAAGVLGSVVCAWLVYGFFTKRKEDA